MNYADAMRRLEGMVAAPTDPALSPEELADLLFDARRPDRNGVEPDEYLPWEENGYYPLGSTLTPTTRNGVYYETTTGGVAGGTEPASWPTTTGATVTSGTAVFTARGAASWEATYDLNAAAADGCDLKAGKCSDRINHSADGASYSEHQTPQFWERRAAYYRSRIVQSAPMRSRFDRRAA